MTRIPSLAQALQLLRATPSPAPMPTAPTTSPPGGAQLAAGAAPAASRATASTRTAGAALRRLPARLKTLRAGDGTLPRSQALRLFIEATLLDELGPQLQLDPAFADLVERTSQALEADDGAASMLDDALQELAALAG